MKLDFLKEKKEIVSIVLLGFSALMAVFILYRIINFSVVTARAENVVKTAIEQNVTEARNTEQYSAKDREIANNLTRNNPFALPATLENPVKEVRAIFGNQVLINNRWYSEGDMISGSAKVVTIEPMQVTIEWNGRETSFRPLDASIPESQESSRATARAGSTGRGSADMVLINGSQTGQASGQMSDRRRMMMDFENMRARFQNMSDAERERLRNEMRQQFGRGGFRGRGGGFPGGGRRGGREGGPGQ
jgi:hypothetical protein